MSDHTTEHGLVIQQAPDRQLVVCGLRQGGVLTVQIRTLLLDDSGEWQKGEGLGLDLTPGAAQQLAQGLEAVCAWEPPTE